jgi:hypothetical protein
MLLFEIAPVQLELIEAKIPELLESEEIEELEEATIDEPVPEILHSPEEIIEDINPEEVEPVEERHEVKLLVQLHS